MSPTQVFIPLSSGSLPAQQLIKSKEVYPWEEGTLVTPQGSKVRVPEGLLDLIKVSIDSRQTLGQRHRRNTWLSHSVLNSGPSESPSFSGQPSKRQSSAQARLSMLVASPVPDRASHSTGEVHDACGCTTN